MPARPVLANDHVPGHGPLLVVRRFLTKETVGDHGRTLHQVGPDSPDYEPGGCPRGASFSWYEYSPGAARDRLAGNVRAAKLP
ncbi:hypothetical protein AB0J55_12215 [Amycolatopsis sp. NPDC049688]|uniref:hypothetical protein n=1 Tax=Amycolatopsis sp. NPDC049688 TaxID=3154733 RepID=UPI00341373C9